jgi:hypothetical protein
MEYFMLQTHLEVQQLMADKVIVLGADGTEQIM